MAILEEGVVEIEMYKNNDADLVPPDTAPLNMYVHYFGSNSTVFTDACSVYEGGISPAALNLGEAITLRFTTSIANIGDEDFYMVNMVVQMTLPIILLILIVTRIGILIIMLIHL